MYFFRNNWFVFSTSSNGTNFPITGRLCGEFTGDRWIPLTKGQWRGALIFALICVWIKGWINNREAGDLRRHCSHYDVIVMWFEFRGLMSLWLQLRIVAWRRAGDKPLNEQMLGKMLGTIWCHNAVQWRHNEHDGFSNHQPHDCLLNHADQKKHQNSVSLAFVRGIHRWPVNAPHRGPVTRKMVPFDDVIMMTSLWSQLGNWTLNI